MKTHRRLIWSCKVGIDIVTDDLPNGSDFPMRMAVRRAYREITGREANFVFSGWNAELTPDERAVVSPTASTTKE